MGNSLFALADQPASLESEVLRELEFRCIGPAVTGGRIHDVEALPQDPSTLYVATASGGLWKSTNQGTTWKPLFDSQPVSTFGDLAVAPSNPEILWVGTGEQQNRQSTSWGNGVYLSTDGGETWTHRGLTQTRHIGRICVHPQDPEVAYVAALGNLWASSETRGVFKTTDGGQTWEKVLFINNFTGVVDLVMDPHNPRVLYAAAYQRLRRTWGFNGGGPGSGIYKTTDGGITWTELTQGIPSGDKGRIGLAVAPTHPDILYATIQHAEKSGTYRTEDGGENWKKVNNLNPRPMYYSHIYVDPTDENRVYVLGSEIYMSEDGGKTFLQLRRNHYHRGISSGPHILWVGTDDGNVQVSRDGGATWEKVGCHIQGVDETTYVSRVEASGAGPGTAWVTLDAHRRGDFRPYVFKTEDFGQTWKKMTQGLPQEGSVNVIREHPDNPDVLFLGTEHSLFVTTNGGQKWVEFSSNLPTTLYDDLKIHPREKDLVVGTHGRSLWILDNTSPLAEWTQAVRSQPAHLFSIRPASLFHYWKSTSYRGQAAYAGDNPPFGAVISYHLNQPFESVKIVIRDPDGHVVQEISASGEAGVIHRVTWDLSHPDPPSRDYDREREGLKMPEKVLPELKHPTELQGPFVSPGTYTVTLHAGSARSTQKVQVKGNPKMTMITQAQYESREAFLVELLELQRKAWDVAEKATSLKEDLEEKESGRADKASQLADRLNDIRRGLYRLAGLYNRSGATQATLYPPTPQHRRQKDRLKKELEEAVEAFQDFEKKVNRP